MKTQIDIVTGFLGSGKTTFINGLLENEISPKDRTVIIQLENGETEIDDILLARENIYVRKVTRDISFDENYICEIIKKYHPHRIIIEHNGTNKLEKLLNILYTHIVQKSCSIKKIIHTIDAVTFDMFMSNIGSILIEQISNSDLIVVNNSMGFSKYKLDKMEKTLNAINNSAHIVRIAGNGVGGEIAAYEDKAVNHRKTSDILISFFFVIAAGYLVFIILMNLQNNGFIHFNLSRLQVLNTVFLSILIQAFPFILIGVVASSLIQVFVSKEAIVRLFMGKRELGFIIAVFAGFLFPVCDCAIVPVAVRLVKKGVPLPTAMTFMLAAPIVNPFVIASTLYAFPGQLYIAFCRVILGITVALAVGLTFYFIPEETAITLNGLDDISCQCGYCGENDIPKGFWGRVDAIFKHAGAEFFEVGRFLIIGAFLSGIVQTLIPKDVMTNIGGGYIVSLAVMMLSAFILSVCSTSDAFIARSFTNQFPIGAVMGFMVLGPMIDIKNVLMLAGNFKKQFVIKLVIVIFVLSFAILSFLTMIFSVLFSGG
jgi:uncharacterized membrane protein YraQ (UPF0718 family)